MHVLFSADFDWKPTTNTTIAYKAGWTGNVRRDCGDAAIAAGRATAVKTPRREVPNSKT